MREIDIIENQSCVNIDSTKELKFREAIADIDSPVGIKVIQLAKEADKIMVSANIGVGEIYYEIQQLLSNPKNGSFTAFLEWRGLNYRTVYRAINAYKFTLTNGQSMEMLETLPTRVLSEAGKTNADPEFKEKVLAGEITSIKEMEQWKEEKRKLTSEKEQAMRDRDYYAQQKVKLEQQLAKRPNEDNQKAVDKARADERQKAESEYTAKLKEERKRIEEQFNNDLRRHENTVAQLENELTILRPLKKREAEIIQKQKEIDEAREEVQRSKVRNTLFTAVASARTNFNNTIYPVVTITITPDAIGETLETELKDLLKMTKDFAFALEQKFNLR